jgi:hypothetical protein
MEKELEQSILNFIKINAVNVLYLLLFLLVLVYYEPGIWAL